LIKFGSLLVYFYFFWAFCSYVVKFWFYRELNAAIIKVDYEVQQSEGMLPQRMQQSQDRFKEQLSFHKLYFNQFQIRKFEGLLNEAHARSEREMNRQIDTLREYDSQLYLTQ
jgi:formate dehydrogenase maturation protein FdhE